jgi:hypothetical protein
MVGTSALAKLVYERGGVRLGSSTTDLGAGGRDGTAVDATERAVSARVERRRASDQRIK